MTEPVQKTMPETLKSLGESLKQKRKERNLSLKEVENGTSIRMNYLQAIEEGTIVQSISPIYAQGFVKQYAVFLGEDGEGLVRHLSKVFQKTDAHEFTYGLGTLEHRGTLNGSVKWLPNLTWALLFVGVLALGWYLARVLEVL